MLSVEQLQQAVDGAMDQKKALGDGIDQAFDETPMDHREPTDAEFLAAFSKRMSEDPYFLYALPLVEGGLVQLRRFEKLMARYAPPEQPQGLF